MTAPAVRSEWPFRYLVALWKHRSNPAASGRKFTGVANVLSMIVTRPSRRPNAAISSSSPTRTSGLVIVSTRNAFVCGVRAAAHVSGRQVSTKL